VAKINLDDILSELGVEKNGRGRPAPKPAKPAPDPRPKDRTHNIDDAEQAFSPIPVMPANQGLRGKSASESVSDDPSVRNKPDSPSMVHVGSAMGELWAPEDDAAHGGEIDQYLVAHGAVTAEQLTAAQQVIKSSPGRRLVDVLIEQGAEEVEIQAAVASFHGLPFEIIDLTRGLEGGFDGKLLQRLGPEYCKAKMVIPLRVEGTRVVIGATRPDDVFLLDDIKQKLEVPAIKLVLVTGFHVRGALEIVGHDSGDGDTDLAEILSSVDEGDVELEKKSGEAVDLEAQAGESPVIRYVNYIIQEASRQGASDIHIEPAEKKLKVRFRIDGVLFEMMNPPPSMSAAITSRIKIMANLDIAERRKPQDGRIRCTVAGRKLDLRVSTLPVGHGEKVVMRILDTRSINVELEALGFDESTMEIWKQQIDAPHGIVLVTGPTGSGKTTTLYSSLRTLDKNKMNISTVEDPIEYHLDGINQTQTHEKAEMTFSLALRALLRQDPDVIMLGEIRDHETAQIAVQASLTGHLVLSTLHTNDAPSSITRLVNIGLEPFLVGAAVNAVLAQRLIRRLCKECKKEEPALDSMREFLEMNGFNAESVWTAKGCDRCRNTGYSGRVGIYELLVVDDELRDIIARNPNVAEFRRICVERGMVSLLEDGVRKVRAGSTSIEEVLRVCKGGH
jgi:type IV pilus assembly protein PilB